MTTWTKRLALAGATLAALAALGAPAWAQTVLVRVLDAETSRPLPGAIGHLVTPSGDVVVSRLADRDGRVLFTDLDVGSYRVRAEMIGHSTGESDPFSVTAGGSVPLVLRLQARAIEIEGVEVTAQAGPCEIRPSEEGRLLADVWEEMRKALSAAALAERQGLYRYSLTTYERELDESGVVLLEDRTRQRGYMRTPFAAHAIEELTGEGFVRRTASEWTYFAPDAPALLSDAFLDTHCFRLATGETDRAGLIGLAFEPTGENEDIPDISGAVWLDRDSVALRWLEFTYENLEPDVRPGDARGRVDFQRLPGGAWIVPEWWIRMPLVEVDLAGNGRRRRITGFRETGGQVLEIVEAGGRDLARGVRTGAIEGIVVDSLGLPVQGVRVGWPGSNQRVFTNGEGRFSLAGLNEGSYRVQFAHPALDSLGLGPHVITRDVRSGVAARVQLVLPTPAGMLRELCGSGADRDGGVLGGVVRSADTDEPVVGADVRVRWSSVELNGARTGLIGREAYTELRTTTDGYGVYRFCAVPRREELSVVVSVDGVDGPARYVALSEGQDAHMSVTRHAPRR